MKNSIILLAVAITLLATWILAGLVSNVILDLPPQELISTMKSDGMIWFMLVFGWIPALVIGYDIDSSFKNDSIKATTPKNSPAELEFDNAELYYDEFEADLEKFLEAAAQKSRAIRAEKKKAQNTLKVVADDRAEA